MVYFIIYIQIIKEFVSISKFYPNIEKNSSKKALQRLKSRKNQWVELSLS